MEKIKIYLVRQSEWGSRVHKDYRPKGNHWKNIESVNNYRDADYLIIISNPIIDFQHLFPPEKTIYIMTEPSEFGFVEHFWRNVPEGAHSFPIEEYGYPTHWHIQLNYDELKQMKTFPEKTKNLTWVTTSFGDGYDPSECQVLSGHRDRMNLLKIFLNKYPDILDLYGRIAKQRRYFNPNFFDNFCGELLDKYDGVRDYRYGFGFENSLQKNYVTDKYTDLVLSGTMPFYWGGTNIEELYPKNSYIWIDISKPYEAADKIVEYINSDFREQHLEELYEAKQLILDKYNFWNFIWKCVNKVHYQ